MSYSSTNNTFTYTITNNTNYVVEQLDYDIILSAFNHWDNIITIDSRFGASYTITISFIIDTLASGVLGGASITNSSYVDTYIYGNVVPQTANITMNNTYLSGLKTTIRNSGYSSYYYVLLHEIGHILGIGSFWYLSGCPKTSYDDNGTTKYYYTGTNALREYKSHFYGLDTSGFVGIPIEDDGGAGTAGVHPEEGDEGAISTDNRYINGILHPGLDTELMTGWLDSYPATTPLSRITLGFLEDMGYTVNYNLADVYIMAWLANTDANNLEQTYIKGFLDVSGGHIINRNGNFSVLDGTMDVSGDVSMNSNLSVGGDVSMNGTTIDICGNLYAQYPNNSIPANAIIGGVSGSSNVFTGDVSMSDNLVIGGDVSMNGNLVIGGTLTTSSIAMGAHMIPTNNAIYDIGSAEYKIRHLFLSDNSLWIGDDHKIDVNGGQMKFKKRKTNVVPESIIAAGGNEAAAIASKSGATILTDLTLKDWVIYAKSLGGTVNGTPSENISIQDIFGNINDNDYQNIQNADIKDSDLALQNKLDVIGVTNLAGGFQLGGVSVNATAAELNTYILSTTLDDISTVSSCYIVAPKSGNITKITTIIDGVTSSNSTIIAGSVNTTAISQQLTIPADSPVATIVSVTTNDSITAGDYIKLSTDGNSTNAVKAVFTIEISY